MELELLLIFTKDTLSIIKLPLTDYKEPQQSFQNTAALPPFHPATRAPYHSSTSPSSPLSLKILKH